MLQLTTINKESLVFCYENEENPNVLFCADSDLSFTTTKLNLKNNSIVTAPHHGSNDNNAAYSNILGKDLMFVRSDRSQSKRPGAGYMAQNEKYCTICRKMGPKKEVVIKYTNNGIIKPQNKCNC